MLRNMGDVVGPCTPHTAFLIMVFCGFIHSDCRWNFWKLSVCKVTWNVKECLKNLKIVWCYFFDQI